MRAHRFTLVAASLIFWTLPTSVLAQRPPSSSGGTKGTGTPSSTVPVLPQQQTQQMLIYNGKVHVAGPPLQDAAKVVARCSGGKSAAAIYSAYTDLKGNFSLTFGQGPSNAPMDASVDPIDPMMNANRGMQVMQCEVTASAAGYISSQIIVQFRSSLDNTEMGKLVLQPISGSNNAQEMGGIVSTISLAAPQNAQHEYAKGIEELRNSKLDKAEKHFRKATEEYPKYSIAWEKLGKLLSDANNRLEARSCFLHAIDADPKYVPPYIALAMMNAEDSQWDSVLELSNKVLSIDPQHFAAAYFLQSAAQYNLGNIAAAEKAGLRAEDLDKQHAHPRIQLLLAEIFNRAGKPGVAAEHLRKFLELDPTSKEADAARTKLAKLEMAAAK